MRIRSTKPEFWRSERIASVSWDARLVLKGLESYVDDNGVGKDDIALIVADVFPRDLSRNPTGTLRKVSEAISDLADAGLLWRYEAAGANLIFVSFWESVQRIEKPTKGRFPRPDGTMNYRDSEIRATLPEPSRNPPGTLRPGTGEQGNRGKKTSSPRGEGATSKPAADDRFDEFWAAYPRKVDKADARRAWAKAIRANDPDQMIAAAKRYAVSVRGKEPDFIKHGSTWLNKGSFENQPELRVVGAPADPEEAFARLRVTADAKAAARLVGQQWLDPAKPPSDPTPMAAFLKAARVAFIDEHADAVLAALGSAEGRAG
jgi:hypothetical protein